MRDPVRLGLCVVVWLALVACASAPSPAATDAAPATDAAASAPQEAPRTMLESTRASVRSTAEWLARGVDSWFGDKPFEDGGEVKDGRLSLSVLERQDEPTDVNLRFKARFRLPNVEEKAYVFIGRDNERELVTDKPDAFTRRQRLLSESSADRSFFAGLGLMLRDSLDVRLGVRGGLKPYAQARYRKPWELGEADLVEFRETVFWTIDDHFGSTTALSYEHAFSPILAARWLNAATITQRAPKFEWSSSIGAYRSFGEQRLLSLELLASGTQDSGVRVSDAGVQVKWEQPVHEDWLIGELIVGHFWPRKEATSERGRAWALGAGLRMHF